MRSRYSRSSFAVVSSSPQHVLLFAPPPHAANALLHFYAAAGHLSSARHLFDEMPFRDIASHNTMMTAYAATTVGCGGGIDAPRHLFDGMLLRNVVSGTS
jgi:pentatricopeptide repeat protein